MKLLYFVQGKAVEDQIGFDDAFKTIQANGGITDYKAVPWLTAEYIHKTFSYTALMRFFVKTVSAVHAARQEGVSAPPPDFDFFLPEVDRALERPYAQRNWIG
jgi:hypothetical protein